MLGILELASQIDGWLKGRLGRLYEGVLATGLGLSIAASIKAIVEAAHARAAGAPGDIAKMVGVIAFEAALLINQLAQLHQGRVERRRRREERAAARRN